MIKLKEFLAMYKDRILIVIMIVLFGLNTEVGLLNIYFNS